MELYMVEVIAESHFRSSNQCLVDFQHVSSYGKSRRWVTAWTVRHASFLEYGHNGQRRIFACPNSGNATATVETSHRIPRIEEASCCISRHNKVKAATERHPAMVGENQMDGCLPRQDCAANNPQTQSRCKGKGAPPPQRAPPRPRMPHAPPDVSERTESSETEVVPPGYVYIHTPHPSTWCFNLDYYPEDCLHHKSFIPDLLTDQGPSTG